MPVCGKYHQSDTVYQDRIWNVWFMHLSVLIWIIVMCCMNLPKKLLNKLQKLQNAAIHIIFNVRSRHPVSSFFRKLHWLNIEQRVIFKCMLLVYKSIHGLSPNALNHMVVVRNRNTLTLQNIFYKQSKYGKRAFIYYASRYWNIIPVDIRCINTLSLFKTALKSYLVVHFMEFKSNISTHFL